MAQDRFINFDTPDENRADINGQLRGAIEAYIGVDGWTQWDHDRWFISLPGADPTTLEPGNRWIEVHRGTDNIDVITRQQDNFTNAVAEGLADRLARRFNGKREQDGI